MEIDAPALKNLTQSARTKSLQMLAPVEAVWEVETSDSESSSDDSD